MDVVAQKYCVSCPVRFECLRASIIMRERGPLWGGMLIKQRDQIYARAQELHGDYRDYNPDGSMMDFITQACEEALRLA